MLADDDIRDLLEARLPELRPDVEAELDRVLNRAGSRSRRRRAAYVGGLVAALVATVLALGHDWRPQADAPAPAEDVGVDAQPLASQRGFYDSPAGLNVGRYEARLLGMKRWPGLRVQLDVLSGWGQDGSYALATGPGDDDDTRRIDLFADVRHVVRVDCPRSDLEVEPGAEGLTDALVALGNASATVEPTTVGGYAAYRVRMDRPLSSVADACEGGVVLREVGDGVFRTLAWPGWTSITWVAEVDETLVVVAASHGPDVTPAEEQELVGIVESLSFVLP